MQLQISDMIKNIDMQIEKLQTARRTLAALENPSATVLVRPDVSSGKQEKQSVSKPAAKKPKKRKLSEAGRQKIADAMRKRWAERRKNVVQKVKLAK